jgi:hypothetical protein
VNDTAFDWSTATVTTVPSEEALVLKIDFVEPPDKDWRRAFKELAEKSNATSSPIWFIDAQWVGAIAVRRIPIDADIDAIRRSLDALASRANDAANRTRAWAVESDVQKQETAKRFDATARSMTERLREEKQVPDFGPGDGVVDEPAAPIATAAPHADPPPAVPQHLGNRIFARLFSALLRPISVFRNFRE